MSIDQIEREVRGLQAALGRNEIHTINELVQYYFKWLEEIEKNNLHGEIEKDWSISEEDHIKYNNVMKIYDQLINTSIDKLNDFVRSETSSFINSDSKSAFLSAVENLISFGKLQLSSVDKESLRKTLLNYLGIARNEQDGAFQMVFDILASPDPDFAEQYSDDPNSEVPSFGQNVADKVFLKRLITKSFGKNYSALKSFSSVKIPDDSDGKLVCPIEHKRKKCEQFIPSTDTYFIAFPFDRQDIEDQLIKACDEKFKLRGVIARKSYESRTALCQICQMILSARFGVYVLTKYSKKEKNDYFSTRFGAYALTKYFKRGIREFLPNPNVMLELGLAMGIRKPTIMLRERDAIVPADLQGYVRIEFDDVKNLTTIIKEWDFSNFYDEANR